MKKCVVVGDRNIFEKKFRLIRPISYLDTLIKTGSESIEATLRRRRILFAGFVARMEDTSLPKCVMFGELVGGAGCVWAPRKKSGWGVSWTTTSLRIFGINADQWTTVAQDEGEWRRTAEQGAEHLFHGEIDRCRESQGWTTACSGSMPERDGKDERGDSSKQGGSCWFARTC